MLFARKTAFFHVFRDIFMNSRCPVKNIFFSRFSGTNEFAKHEKTVFFHVFRDTLYKVRKNEKKFFFSCEKSVRKQRFLSTLFCTMSHVFRHFVKVRAKKQLFQFFHVFQCFFLRDTLYKVRKKYAKNSVFLSFLHERKQSFSRKKCEKKQCFCTILSRKQRFFTFFETLSTKFEEKQRFLSFLHDVPLKVRGNSFFHVFRDTSYKVRKNANKQRFFNFLHDIKKSVRKQCFFYVFRDISYKVQKMRKNSVFWAFARCPTKIRENSVFHVFEFAKFAKTAKNSVFWAFCTMSHKKVRENSVFSRFFHVFRDTLYKVRKICEKKQRVFVAFCTTSRRKCEKSVFFHDFRDTLYEFAENVKKRVFWKKSVRKRCFFTFWALLWIRRKCEKTAFFERMTSRKKCEKTVFFFTFFETLCTKLAKNAKNSVFWDFCTMSHKKLEKTVLFHVFRDTLYKVRKIWEKTAVFSAVCTMSCKKCEKTAFFHVFRDTLY